MAVVRLWRSVGPLAEDLPVTATVPVPALALAPPSTLTLAAATPQPAAGSTLFMPPDQLQALPDSGGPWDRLVAVANGGQIGIPNVSDQNNTYQAWLIANALVYARTGNATNRSRVVTGVRDSIGTEDINTSNSLLGPSRTIPGTVVAAAVAEVDPDVTGTRAGYTATTFRSWLRTMLTKGPYGNHGKWNRIDFTAHDSATNWGCMSRVSKTAIIRYLRLLGEATQAEWDDCIALFRRWLGDRSYATHWASPNGIGQNWQPSYILLEPQYGATAAEQTDQIRLNNYVGVGVAASKGIGGLPYDGIIVTDLCRDSTVYNGNYGGYDPAKGVMYSWGVIEASFLEALIFHYAGQTDVWSWSDEALRRTVAFLDRAGENPERADTRSHWVGYTLNSFYGTSYPTAAVAGHGRMLGWTDWLYGA